MAGSIASDGYSYTDAGFEPACLVAPAHISGAGSTPRHGTHAANDENTKISDTQVADDSAVEKASSPTLNASQSKPSAQNLLISSTTASNNSTGPVGVGNTNGPTFASGEQGDKGVGADRAYLCLHRSMCNEDSGHQP
ncbi:hypothetical protein GQ607_011776 [Colletotrichum asianum]|uniref:Uncharacterized protein n=1 Tax=Colletotrichum asianum TaxID=702518 RepID=A0A8H3WAB0_9PEZI|nr:hypothetical protein GQ607_011776 [Colletotrichum asianum]